MNNIENLTAYRESKDELETAYLSFASVWNKHFNISKNLNGKECFKRMYCAFRLLDCEINFSRIFCGEYFEREKIKKMLQAFVDSI